MSADAAGPQIGLIGAGRMATALAKGFVRARFTTAQRIIAADVDASARTNFEREASAATTDANAQVLQQSQIVVLAVKPQSMPSVLKEIGPLVRPEHLIVSIAAGVKLDTLASALGKTARLARVMPNMPCLIGKGASAFAIGGSATPEDAIQVQNLLATVGTVCQVGEALLDAVTGLSGSGPAYVFEIIEALSDGGVCAGLPRAVAVRLAAQTVLGAAEMVLSTGRHPAELKDAVASPGGTTIAGLLEMERGGVRAALMNAVMAATARSQELGRS